MKIRVEWMCPNCGMVAVWIQVDDVSRIKCPVCGLPMKGEKKEK